MRKACSLLTLKIKGLVLSVVPMKSVAPLALPVKAQPAAGAVWVQSIAVPPALLVHQLLAVKVPTCGSVSVTLPFAAVVMRPCASTVTLATV